MSELEKELTEIIQKMAEYIDTLDIDEDICKKQKVCYKEDYPNSYLDCKECIIDYFKEVVKV